VILCNAGKILSSLIMQNEHTDISGYSRQYRPTDKPGSMYTPHSILEIFRNSLSVKEDRKMINIRGIYLKKDGPEYAGRYYDKLKDESSDYALTLQVPAVFRSHLVHGKAIEFEGFISKIVRKEGNIELQVTIAYLIRQRESTHSEDEINRLEIQRRKASQGIKNCDELIKNRLYRNQPVDVIFLTGKGAITDRDVMETLKSNKDFYRIRQVRANFASVDDILQTISRSDIQNADILCIFRGGGLGLEVFNDFRFGEFLLSSKPALISAIGHEKDVTLVELIADKKCITPSALGTYLNDIYEKSIREKEDSEAYLTKMLHEKFQLQNQQAKEAYQKTIEESKRNYEQTIKQIQENHVRAIKDRDEQVLKLNQLNERSIQQMQESHVKSLKESESQISKLKEANQKYLKDLQTRDRQLLIIVVAALVIGLIIGMLLQ
jgi:exodeoxyribonuclease VII large subunit